MSVLARKRKYYIYCTFTAKKTKSMEIMLINLKQVYLQLLKLIGTNFLNQFP